VVRSLPLGVQWAIARRVKDITNVPKFFAHLEDRNVISWCLGASYCNMQYKWNFLYEKHSFQGQCLHYLGISNRKLES
jgi:hypothetical protein